MRIVIVDDIPIYRTLFSLALEMDGESTRTFAEGRVALDHIIDAAESPESDGPASDLLLLDGTLPDIDPLEFLSVLRSHPATVHTPVVVTLAIPERALVRGALRLGVRDFYFKGEFTPQHLRQRLREVTGRVELDDQLQRLMHQALAESAEAQSSEARRARRRVAAARAAQQGAK